LKGGTLIGKRVAKIKGASYLGAMRTLIALALSATLVLSGCGRGRARARIGVTLPADTSAFLHAVVQGMRHVADSLDVELEIRADAGDAAHQAADIGGFVDRGVSALVLVPVSPTGLVAAIARATGAHVPVFTAVAMTDGGPIVSHIAGDDGQGGELVAWYLAQRLRGGGNVVILDQPEVASVRDRVAGIRRLLGGFPNLRIVASPAVDPGSREAARRKTATLLASDQRIDAFVGTTGELALGALAAVQAAGKTDAVVVAYGGGAEARTAILQGTPLIADIVTDPGTLGRYAIAVAASHLRGNRVASAVPVRVRLVDRDSLVP
jgi:ribose transport system substrate-binding protein